MLKNILGQQITTTTGNFVEKVKEQNKENEETVGQKFDEGWCRAFFIRPSAAFPACRRCRARGSPRSGSRTCSRIPEGSGAPRKEKRK